jgi:hypothetical protein
MMLILQADTAIDSYRGHRRAGISDCQRERICAFLRVRGGDWSIGELAAELHLEKSTVSARLHELLYEEKRIEEAPKRRDRISGITVRPVRAPITGQIALF